MIDDDSRPRPTPPTNVEAEVRRLLEGAGLDRPGKERPSPEPPPFTDAATPDPLAVADDLIPMVFSPAPAGTEASPPDEILPPESAPSLDEVVRDIDAPFLGTEDSRPAAAERASLEAGALRARYALFVLGPTTFGLPIRNVREVDSVPRVTPVPNVPDWLKGVANLRGDVLSVIDLRAFFGIDETPEPSRMLVVQSDGGDVATAFLVDSVPGMARLDPSGRKPLDAIASQRILPFAVGLAEHGGRLVTLLDPSKILRSPDLDPFQSA